MNATANKGLKIVLALLLALSLAACGGNQTTGGATADPGAKTADAGKSADPGTADPGASGEPTKSTELPAPVKFTYLRPVWNPPTYEKGNAFEKELFQVGNVEIEVSIVPVADFDVKLPTMLAGGTDIDVIWSSSAPNSGNMRDFYEQGAFLPLDDLLEKYPAVKAVNYDATWELTKSGDGHQYFFPAPLSPWVPFPVIYRKDIFDKHGLKVPTTLDEFNEVLRQLKTLEPDRYPITQAEYFSEWGFQNVGMLFGYNFGWMIDPDDANRMIPGTMTKQYRDFLEWENMLCREKLMDPDYMVAKGKRGEDTLKGGRAVIMATHWGAYADIVQQTQANEPEAEYDFFPIMTGPGGKSYCKTLTGYDRGFCINAKSAAKADDIFKFLNWLYTDGYEVCRYGFEGKTFNKDANGNYISIPNPDRDPAYDVSNVEPVSFPLKAEDTLPNWVTTKNEFEARGLKLEDVEKVRKAFEDAAGGAYYEINRETYSKTASEKGTQLDEQYIKPAREKLMMDPTADMSILDEAIQKWLADGGEQIIKEMNENQPDKSIMEMPYQYTGPDYR